MDEGFIPIQSEVAKAIEKTPQSLPPTCICATWKCKVIFLSGVQTIAAICSFALFGRSIVGKLSKILISSGEHPIVEMVIQCTPDMFKISSFNVK